jgi:hypothetical protein
VEEVMMYQEKFVAVVKCNGKVLREQGDSLFLPFGSEYSILLKNLNNTRALVQIEIDGRKVTGDGGLVVNANDSVELERFIDMDDLNKGYKFKFIEKTQEISDHRGDKVEDGIIRIEWWYEVVKPVFRYVPSYRKDTYWLGSAAKHEMFPSFGSEVTYTTSHSSCCNLNQVSAQDDYEPIACASSPLRSVNKNFVPEVNEAGITVEGSDSNQKFMLVQMNELESVSHVIVFNLRGLTAKKAVAKPIYVSDKIRCKSCGRKWHSGQQFCGNCGTRLIA